MKIEETGLNGLKVITPQVFDDERGYFFESYNQNKYNEIGIVNTFVQDNESKSKYGTIRGLHFQKSDSAQAKLVEVISGEVLDVVVDLRSNSSTFGKKFEIELTSNNKKQLFIPRGFAHGFSVLSEEVIFRYKCDNFYNPSAESGIIYNDIDLDINWRIPKDKINVSKKDLQLKSFKEFKGDFGV